MEPKKYRRIWVAEQPLIKQHTQMERYLKCRHIVGNVAENAIIWAENGRVESHLTEESIKKINEDGKKFLNNGFAARLLEEKKPVIKEYWETASKIRKEVSKEKLTKLFKDFDRIILKVFAYFITSWEPTTLCIEKEIEKILEKEYGGQYYEKFILMTTPTEKDLLYREKENWLNILKKPSENKIKEHMLKFPFLFCNIDSEEDAFEIMKKRSGEQKIKDVEKEIKETETRLKNTKKEQEKILAQVKSKKLEQLTWLLQNLSLLRLELKACWSGMHFYLLPFFKKIAEIADAGTRDVMMFYSTKDIINLLENNQNISKEELDGRRECYILLFDYPNINFYSGNEARKAKKVHLDPYLPELTTTFRGTIANKGKVRGTAKIVRVDDLRELVKIAKTLTKEHILVTGMTNPNMVPLIEKISGIVTDEGGMACHAAIVSREFNIPCIVGCSIATKAIEDGDYIEVDAEKGIVKILKRKS